jgi:hypothetical protein
VSLTAVCLLAGVRVLKAFTENYEVSTVNCDVDIGPVGAYVNATFLKFFNTLLTFLLEVFSCNPQSRPLHRRFSSLWCVQSLDVSKVTVDGVVIGCVVG